jgi:hypothetical protein
MRTGTILSKIERGPLRDCGPLPRAERRCFRLAFSLLAERLPFQRRGEDSIPFPHPVNFVFNFFLTFLSTLPRFCTNPLAQRDLPPPKKCSATDRGRWKGEPLHPTREPTSESAPVKAVRKITFILLYTSMFRAQ